MILSVIDDKSNSYSISEIGITLLIHSGSLVYKDSLFESMMIQSSYNMRPVKSWSLEHIIIPQTDLKNFQ